MKVYIVTSGEYSSYHIDAVFTDEVMANQYKNLDTGRNVEVFDADSVSVTNKSRDLVLYVTYDFEIDTIESFSLTSDRDEEPYVSEWNTEFCFYLIPSGPVYDDILEHERNSELLLKVARDRFHKYLEHIEMSREELIRKINDKLEKDRKMYAPYVTSATVEWKQFTIANEQCSQILHQLIESGVQLPSATELQDMREGIISDILLKGEENNEQN